jgi:hypothetical protein
MKADIWNLGLIFYKIITKESNVRFAPDGFLYRLNFDDITYELLKNMLHRDCNKRYNID